MEDMRSAEVLRRIQASPTERHSQLLSFVHETPFFLHQMIMTFTSVKVTWSTRQDAFDMFLVPKIWTFVLSLTRHCCRDGMLLF